ncbi:Hypothetical predicted protein [Pelobates cultripes]|uniref:exodeoxyribonuclease III n=1 Tax=Pelobates cultripes TaxID=61616 RepID=A0AAD1RZS3_PELCU|nr:Hypothetical predicted protein [Pelobates cultripes]
MAQINLMSLNVRGLNTPEKHSMLAQEIDRQRADITFIQETHFRGEAQPRIRAKHLQQSYHSNYRKSKSRGVAILVNTRAALTDTTVKADPGGRFLFVKGKCLGTQVTLANIYAPNTDQGSFARSCLNKLEAFAEGMVIIGGDWNMVLDHSIDSTTHTMDKRRHQRTLLANALFAHQLMDCWRITHPQDRDYTYTT